MSNPNLLLVAEALNSLTYLDLKSLVISITDQHENLFTDEDDIALANAVAEWADAYIQFNQDKPEEVLPKLRGEPGDGIEIA